MVDRYTTHELEKVEEGDTQVHRCTKCGLIYKQESAFEMFRCSGGLVDENLEEE